MMQGSKIILAAGYRGYQLLDKYDEVSVGSWLHCLTLLFLDVLRKLGAPLTFSKQIRKDNILLWTYSSLLAGKRPTVPVFFNTLMIGQSCKRSLRAYRSRDLRPKVPTVYLIPLTLHMQPG